MKRSNETFDLRLREAYSWLLVPVQEAGGAWQWEATRILGDGSIPHRASRKLRDSEQLITRWSPALLRMELDRWLWRDMPHLGVKKLWEYLCTYGYLPRLQDQDVLLEAIAEGLRSRDYFGYAGSVSASGRYEGLIFGQPTLASSLHLDELSVLVKRDVARAQQKADEEAEETATTLAGAGTQEVTQPAAPIHGRPGTSRPGSVVEQARPVLRRYHGSVKLDPERLVRDASRVAEEIVQHLVALRGAHVEVTLDIAAHMPDGAPEHVVRTVMENRRTHRFTSQGFEDQ